MTDSMHYGRRPIAGAGGLLDIPDPAATPEDYELVIPDDLALAGFAADPEDRFYRIFAPLFRRHGVDQATFNEFAEAYFRLLAEDHAAEAEERRAEQQAFIEAFGPGDGAAGPEAYEAAKQAAQPIATWFATLLGPSLAARPGMLAALQDLVAFNDGVLLLKAIRDAVGERTPSAPPASAGAAARRPVEDILYGRRG